MATADSIQIVISAESAELKAAMSEAAAAVANGATQMRTSMEGAAQGALTASYEMGNAAAAAAASIGTAMASIGASMKVSATSFEVANTAVASFTATLETLSKFAIVGLFIEGANKLRELANATNEAEASLAHMSTRTGVSVSELHGLSDVFGLAEVSGQSFERIMRMLETRLESAAGGSTDAQAKFANLGLSWETLKGQSPEQLFFTVTQAVADLSDGTDKLSAVVGLLGGRFGTQLLPVMDLGTTRVKELIGAFQTLDPVTKQNADDAVSLHAAWAALEAVSGSFGRALVHDLREALEAVIQSVTRLFADLVSLKTLLVELLSGESITKAAADAQAAGQRILDAAHTIAQATRDITGAGTIAPPDVVNAKAASAREFTGDQAEALGFPSNEEALAALENIQRIARQGHAALFAEASAAADQMAGLQTGQSQIQRAQIEQNIQLGITSEAQGIAQLAALDQQDAANKEASIKAKIASLLKYESAEVSTTAKLQKLYTELFAAQNAAVAKGIADQTKEIQSLAKSYETVFGAIGNSFNQLLSGMLRGNQSFVSLIKAAGLQLLDSFVSMETQQLTKFLAVEAAKLQAYVFGTSAQKTADISAAASKAALDQTAALAQITTSAGEAAAAQFADVMITVPYPENLAVAPAAAATAFAETMAFAAFAGGGIVPSDMLALVHGGEMVLPRPISETIQNITNQGSGNGAREIKVYLTVNSTDPKGFKNLLSDNKVHLTRIFEEAMRNAT
jgi:hypothetical protein